MDLEQPAHELANRVMQLLAEKRALETKVEYLKETERQLMETIRELEERIES